MTAISAAPPSRARSRLSERWRQIRANRSVMVGGIITGLIVLLAVLGPVLWPLDPLGFSKETFRAPSFAHPMGTDDLGRDVFARVILGARISLTVGLVSGAIATLFGSFVGALSGYFGGRIDEAVMRLTELFQIIPRFLLAIVVVALFGSGIVKLVLVIGLLSWPGTARIVRAQFMVLRSEEFALSAVMSGARPPRVILRHIIPNILAFIAVSAFLQTGGAILVESFLSFLGLGDPARPSWGLLLQQSQLYLRAAWWMSVFPGLALALTIFGINLLGDGIGGAQAVGRKTR